MNYDKIKDINNECCKILRAGKRELMELETSINDLNHRITEKEASIKELINSGSEEEYTQAMTEIETLKRTLEFRNTRLGIVSKSQLISKEQYTKLVGRTKEEYKKISDNALKELVKLADNMWQIGEELSELANFTNITLELIQRDLYGDLDRVRDKNGNVITNINKQEVDRAVFDFCHWAFDPAESYSYERITGKKKKEDIKNVSWCS